MNNKAIIKQEYFYKYKNSTYYNKIKKFYKLNKPLTESIIINFFEKLHSVDINYLYDKCLYIETCDDNKVLGQFKALINPLIEMQKIFLNPLSNCSNELYRKSMILSTYFHETQHEKQRDYFVYNNFYDVQEVTEYDKYLSLEYFYTINQCIYTQDFSLMELDAIYSSIKKYKDVLNHNAIPTTPETLSVGLYQCVKYFALHNSTHPLNFHPHTTPKIRCKLVEYYKKFYNYVLPKKMECDTDEFIYKSDLFFDNRKYNLSHISFDKLSEEIEYQMHDTLDCMTYFYSELIKQYKPSDRICDYFNVNEDNWNIFINKCNMFEISSLICKDLHYRFTKPANKILENEHEA